MHANCGALADTVLRIDGGMVASDWMMHHCRAGRVGCVAGSGAGAAAGGARDRLPQPPIR